MASEQLNELFARIHCGFRRSLRKGSLLMDPCMLSLQSRLLSLQPELLTQQTPLDTRFIVMDTETTGLSEGVPKTARLEDPPGAFQGKNSWPTTGYRGPAPPRGSGTHRYVFKLYALDAQLEIEPEVDKQALITAMSGRVIGEGRLIGTYDR